MDIHHVSITVNQVAAHIHCSALAVNVALPIRTFFEIWCSVRIQIDFALDPLNVELGEWEDLRELSRLQICLLPKLPACCINDIALSINQVALLIHKPSKVVEQLVAVRNRLNIAILVLVELANNIFNVKSLAIIIK